MEQIGFRLWLGFGSLVSIIMLINLKGGVAKTTNAVAIAESLAYSGHRTLIIDADHQCMASELVLGERRLLDCERKERTIHDMLKASIHSQFTVEQFGNYIQSQVSDIGGGMEHLSALPCSFRIDDFHTNMAKARHGYKTTDEWMRLWNNRRVQFKRWIQKNYDHTIIDCPPSFPIQVQFLFPVADSFIVPSVPDRLSVRGSVYLMERIRKKGYKIQGLGTLWSLFRQQNAIHCKIVERGKRGVTPCDRLPKAFETVIPNAAAIAEATEVDRHPKSFQAKYSSKFARLFMNLSQEILTRSKTPVANKKEPTESTQVPQS